MPPTIDENEASAKPPENTSLGHGSFTPPQPKPLPESNNVFDIKSRLVGKTAGLEINKRTVGERLVETTLRDRVKVLEQKEADLLREREQLKQTNKQLYDEIVHLNEKLLSRNGDESNNEGTSELAQQIRRPLRPTVHNISNVTPNLDANIVPPLEKDLVTGGDTSLKDSTISIPATAPPTTRENTSKLEDVTLKETVVEEKIIETPPTPSNSKLEFRNASKLIENMFAGISPTEAHVVGILNGNFNYEVKEKTKDVVDQKMAQVESLNVSSVHQQAAYKLLSAEPESFSLPFFKDLNLDDAIIAYQKIKNLNAYKVLQSHDVKDKDIAIIDIEGKKIDVRSNVSALITKLISLANSIEKTPEEKSVLPTKQIGENEVGETVEQFIVRVQSLVKSTAEKRNI